MWAEANVWYQKAEIIVITFWVGNSAIDRGGSLIPVKLAFTVCTGQEDVVLVSLRLFDCVRMALLPCGQAVFL